MKKFVLVFGAALLVVGLAVTGAVAKTAKKSAKTEVCFLMPDTKTSVRWDAVRRAVARQGIEGAEVSYIDRERAGRPAEAEGAGRPVHRRTAPRS